MTVDDLLIRLKLGPGEFQKAALETHPDLNPGDPDAASNFQDLIRARELLLEDDGEKFSAEIGYAGFGIHFTTPDYEE